MLTFSYQWRVYSILFTVISSNRNRRPNVKINLQQLMGTSVYQVWRRFKDRIPVLKEFGIRWANHIKLRKASWLRQSNKCLLDPRCVQRHVVGRRIQRRQGLLSAEGVRKAVFWLNCIPPLQTLIPQAWGGPWDSVSNKLASDAHAVGLWAALELQG